MLSSRSLSLALFTGALLLAGSASALTLSYTVTGTMAMTNQTCTAATCNVPVTGTMTLDDDEAGTVTITALNLAHVGYEVASPALLSVILTRTDITLGAGSLAGSGSTLGALSFGSTTLAQTGTIDCVPGFFECSIAGFPPGPGPMSGPLPPNPDPSPTAMGNWLFDGSRNLLSSGPITYTNTVTPQTALETLTLSATLIPEPGTGLLMAVGLMGMALRRRAVR